MGGILFALIWLGTAWLGLAVCNFYKVKTDFTHLGLAFLASDQTHTQKKLDFPRFELALIRLSLPCLPFCCLVSPPPLPLPQHLPACLLALSLFIPLCVFPLISPPPLSLSLSSYAFPLLALSLLLCISNCLISLLLIFSSACFHYYRAFRFFILSCCALPLFVCTLSLSSSSPLYQNNFLLYCLLFFPLACYSLLFSLFPC